MWRQSRPPPQNIMIVAELKKVFNPTYAHNFANVCATKSETLGKCFKCIERIAVGEGQALPNHLSFQ